MIQLEINRELGFGAYRIPGVVIDNSIVLVSQTSRSLSKKVPDGRTTHPRPEPLPPVRIPHLSRREEDRDPQLAATQMCDRQTHRHLRRPPHGPPPSNPNPEYHDAVVRTFGLDWPERVPNGAVIATALLTDARPMTSPDDFPTDPHELPVLRVRHRLMDVGSRPDRTLRPTRPSHRTLGSVALVSITFNRHRPRIYLSPDRQNSPVAARTIATF